MGRSGRIFAVVGLLALIGSASAHGSSFSNGTRILVPACLQGDCSGMGPADPYPSAIDVSGLPGAVVKVTATLRQVFNGQPDEIDALLVAPGGQSVLLISDACAGTPFAPLAGESFTFDDAAGASLSSSGPCATGRYRPTDYPPADSFGPGGPSPPFGTSLSGLAGGPSNGVWQLFVVDDGPGSQVNQPIADGWSLDLLPAANCAGKAASVAAHVGTAGADVLTGTPGPDVMLGLGGDDSIDGLGGKDVICGGEGNDTLIGGPGKDLLRGETGNDRLNGEGGKDKLKGGSGRDLCKGGPKPDTAKGCEKPKSI